MANGSPISVTQMLGWRPGAVLNDMLPANAFEYLVYLRTAYWKPCCYLANLEMFTFRQPSYFTNIIIRQLMVRMGHTIRRNTVRTFARIHIAEIVRLRPCIEMAWIAAGWIIALVQNIMPIRDNSGCKFQGNSMGQNSTPIHSYAPIALFIFAASPDPAFLRMPLFYSLPEAICYVHARIVAMNEAARLAFYKTEVLVVLMNNRRLFAAAALAIAVGDFLRRLFGGILVHIGLLSRLIMQRDGDTSPLLCMTRIA